MPRFGTVSEQNLAKADPRLVRVCRRAIQVFDFSVTNAHGKAVDLAPWPVDWSANAWPHVRFGVLAGVIFAAAAAEGVTVAWGQSSRKNWTAGELAGQGRFLAWAHFQLTDP